MKPGDTVHVIVFYYPGGLVGVTLKPASDVGT